MGDKSLLYPHSISIIPHICWLNPYVYHSEFPAPELPGILVFLPGIGEISELQEILGEKCDSGIKSANGETDVVLVYTYIYI